LKAIHNSYPLHLKGKNIRRTNTIKQSSDDCDTYHINNSKGIPTMENIIIDGNMFKNPFQNFLLRIILFIKNLLNININTDNTEIVINAKIFITF